MQNYKFITDTRYHDNGEVKYRSSLLDDDHCLVERFYEDGQLMMKYQKNKKNQWNGLWEDYIEDGSLISKGNYRNDIRIGLWSYANKTSFKYFL